MIGTCALCQKNADLQDGHLIPKWAYKRVCNVNPTGAKNPVIVADGNAFLSSKQTKKYLLCFDCEQRFSKSEDYVAGLTEPDNGQIKLFRDITRLDTPKKVLASLNKDVDCGQIAYFAASVMWRVCVITTDCKLGPYEPSFRKYLLGETRFPPEAALFVGLFEKSPNVDTRGWVSEPTSKKAGLLWYHGFLIAGLAFKCFVGKAINQNMHQSSLVGPNPDKYVSIIKPEECGDFLAAVEMASNAKHRGNLARVG